MKHRRTFEDWKTLVQNPLQLERNSINQMLKDWESDRTKLKKLAESSTTDKHGQFEDWQKTVQEQNCAPDRDTIDRIMKAWEFDRTHLKSELTYKNETFDDILNYGWGLLYPGKTDWEYPGQVINHLWAEIELQKKKATELEKIAREMMLSGNFLYDTVCSIHGDDWEMTKVWKLLSLKIKESLKSEITSNKGKTPEPIVTGIDLALHSDVTVLSVVHPNSNGSSVVDKIEGI
jgi:hypothetical protein